MRSTCVQTVPRQSLREHPTSGAKQTIQMEAETIQFRLILLVRLQQSVVLSTVGADTSRLFSTSGHAHRHLR